MSSITDQMTTLFVFVDDFLKANTAQAAWRRSPNSQPAFTDAEVLTIGLMQSCLGVATLKQAYLLIAHNFGGAFPKLPCYGQWLSRLHALSKIVGMLIEQALLPLPSQLYLLDSKPSPVCKPIRNGRVRLLREEGAYFGKNKAGWYFGFKLHLLAHQNGAILAAILTPANWDDRDAAVALALCVDGGVTLADRGYIGPETFAELVQEAEMLLITPADAAKDTRRALISSLRERVETCFSGLWRRFVDRVYSRSFAGLWNAVKLKMLHYNLCHNGFLPA